MSPKHTIIYDSPPPPYQKSLSTPELGLTAEKKQVYNKSIRKRSSSLKYLAVTAFIFFLLIGSFFYYFLIKPSYLNSKDEEEPASRIKTKELKNKTTSDLASAPLKQSKPVANTEPKASSVMKNAGNDDLTIEKKEDEKKDKEKEKDEKKEKEKEDKEKTKAEMDKEKKEKTKEEIDKEKKDEKTKDEKVVEKKESESEDDESIKPDTLSSITGMTSEEAEGPTTVVGDPPGSTKHVSPDPDSA